MLVENASVVVRFIGMVVGNGLLEALNDIHRAFFARGVCRGTRNSLSAEKRLDWSVLVALHRCHTDVPLEVVAEFVGISFSDLRASMNRLALRDYDYFTVWS